MPPASKKWPLSDLALSSVRGRREYAGVLSGGRARASPASPILRRVRTIVRATAENHYRCWPARRGLRGSAPSPCQPTPSRTIIMPTPDGRRRGGAAAVIPPSSTMEPSSPPEATSRLAASANPGTSRGAALHAPPATPLAPRPRRRADPPRRRHRGDTPLSGGHPRGRSGPEDLGSSVLRGWSTRRSSARRGGCRASGASRACSSPSTVRPRPGRRSSIS